MAAKKPPIVVAQKPAKVTVKKEPEKPIDPSIPEFIRTKPPAVEVLVQGRSAEDCLKTWLVLAEVLKEATLEEAYLLLHYEARHARRPSVLSRIFGRYNKLRFDAEWRYFRGL